MAVPVDPDAVAAMEQTNGSEWVVTAFYGSQQTIPSANYPGLDRVPITTDGRITFDADAETQSNGSLYLAFDGQSLVPEEKTDPLAPYGQELSIVRRVSYADNTWDVPLGRFRIQNVPDTSKLFKSWPGVSLQQVGWAAQLDVTDLFDRLLADDFLQKTGPTKASTWDEIQLLSPIPIVVSLDDQPVPAGLVYQSRFDAITQLMANLGGEPHLTRQGQLTARVKNNWLTATVPVAVVNGAVTVSGGMSNNLKNSVAVTNPSNATILGLSEVNDPTDPLCVDGPLGRRTEELSDPLMDTQTKAQKASVTALARLSTQQSRVVSVSCLPRPDLELGDYIQVNEVVENVVVAEWFGEVRKMEFSMNPTDLMTFDLTVAEKR